jgi:hypothetical protein
MGTGVTGRDGWVMLGLNAAVDSESALPPPSASLRSTNPADVGEGRRQRLRGRERLAVEQRHHAVEEPGVGRQQLLRLRGAPHAVVDDLKNLFVVVHPIARTKDGQQPVGDAGAPHDLDDAAVVDEDVERVQHV